VTNGRRKYQNKWRLLYCGNWIGIVGNNDQMSDAALRTSLLDLYYELQKKGVPLILGGGYGLYLKQTATDWDGTRTLITPEKWPSPRSTEDLDLFLTAEVVGDAAQMDVIRQALDALGYEPIAKHFQFSKDPENKNEVKIDLLTGPIPANFLEFVKVNYPRVGNRQASLQLHAHLTEEALSLNEELLCLQIDGKRSSGEAYTAPILVPNAFTFMLMKLHAFYDRIDSVEKALGRHHALDLYRIIAMMNDKDYDTAKELINRHRDADPCKQASFIIHDCFDHKDSIGLVRLQEHESYRADMGFSDFSETLKDLFKDIERKKPIPRRAPKSQAETVSSEGIVVSATQSPAQPVIPAGTVSKDKLDVWRGRITKATSVEQIFTILDEFRPYQWTDDDRAQMAKAYIMKIDRLKVDGH
jgi:hypothetical protein